MRRNVIIFPSRETDASYINKLYGNACFILYVRAPIILHKYLIICVRSENFPRRTNESSRAMEDSPLLTMLSVIRSN